MLGDRILLQVEKGISFGGYLVNEKWYGNVNKNVYW